MIYIGNLEPLIYESLVKKLQDRHPDLQSENSTSAVLKVIGKDQLIALQGLYKRGSYEVYLLEIRAPGNLKELTPLTDESYKDAKEEVNLTITEIYKNQ